MHWHRDPTCCFLLLFDVYFVTLFALCFFSDFPLVWQVHISPSKCFMQFVLSLPWPDNKRHACWIITYLLRYHSEIRKKTLLLPNLHSCVILLLNPKQSGPAVSLLQKISIYRRVLLQDAARFWIEKWGTKGSNNREHIHLFCVAAIDLFHVWGVKTFQLFQRESDQAIIHCLHLFFCFFPVYLTCVAMSTQQYSSLTWQTFRRNYSAVSFDLFVWLLPEISWF